MYGRLALDPEQEVLSDPPAAEYERAFAEVSADPRQRLLVIEVERRVVGTIVLIVVPNISRRGRPYALIENVVVDEGVRGHGYGATLMRYAIDQARDAGCYKVSLTSRTQRADAHRFYERLGFAVSSEGFRMAL